jgi:2-iminobutanoate/2-iminopropanoate deaminase
VTQRAAQLATVSTPDAPRPTDGAPYSQAVLAGGLVFTAGQLPVDPVTGGVVGDDVTSQTHQVMRNLQAVLTAAGSDLQRVVRVTVYLTKRSHWARMNAVYAEYVGSPAPARTAVIVSEMAPGVLVEVDAIAVC